MPYTPDAPDFEGAHLAENHQRTGRDVAGRLLAATSSLHDGDSISVRRTHVSVRRAGSALTVWVGGETHQVTATSGAECPIDMLAHSRGELLRMGGAHGS